MNSQLIASHEIPERSTRRGFLAGLGSTALGAALLGACGSMMISELSALNRATQWFNSPPLTAAGLRGKVVLINFCTYTCINWLRTLPYVRAWAEKYQAHGLVVIGVHTPEFSFEKDLDNVRQAISELQVAHPIVVDNDYAIWQAFDNHYWPALYFVDEQGKIRSHHFGEGAYAESEKMIQKLLNEAGAGGVEDEVVVVEAHGPEVEADWANLRTGETYVGYGRTQGFASPGGIIWDEEQVYTAPTYLGLNQWALAGEWTVEQEAMRLNAANGRILFRFHARDLHLVMGPPKQGNAVRFRILLDGQPPSDAYGVDVDSQGYGIASYRRMYQLIRQTQPVADRLFEIEFLDAGVEAFAFTFG